MAPRKIFRRHYDSASDMAAVLPSDINRDTYDRYERSVSHKGADWFGVASVEEVIRLVRAGWPEGAKRVTEIACKPAAQPQSLRRRRVRADFGNELDIHSVYAGQLATAWGAMRRQLRQAVREVALVAPIGVKCSVSPEQLFWRGAALLRAADLLHEAGYAVAIIGAYVSHDIDEQLKWDMIHTVQIKTVDQPLNPSVLAATVCLAGFVRVCGFRALSSDESIKTTSAMGHYNEAKLNELVEHYIATELTGRHVITTPPQLYDQEAATRWVEQAIDTIEAHTRSAS